MAHRKRTISLAGLTKVMDVRNVPGGEENVDQNLIRHVGEISFGSIPFLCATSSPHGWMLKDRMRK